MNNAPDSATLSADLATVYGLSGGFGMSCIIRDIWAQKEIHVMRSCHATAVSATLASHDSAFFIVTASYH